MIPPNGACNKYVPLVEHIGDMCSNIRKLYDIYIKKQNWSKEPKNNVIMRFSLESMAGLW